MAMVKNTIPRPPIQCVSERLDIIYYRGSGRSEARHCLEESIRIACEVSADYEWQRAEPTEDDPYKCYKQVCLAPPHAVFGSVTLVFQADGRKYRDGYRYEERGNVVFLVIN